MERQKVASMPKEDTGNNAVVVKNLTKVFSDILFLLTLLMSLISYINYSFDTLSLHFWL